jgi:3-hydroxymyristoyl/3-hydroxydecanoyl-(acyl carrier protein) dehydratase
MGQSCNLATVLLVLLERAEAQGVRAEDVLELLGQVEVGFRLQPGVGPQCLSRLRAHLPPAAAFMGFMAAAEVKFLAPVLAGHRLDYAVERTHVVGDMVRYAVEATVDGRPVARGTLTSTVGLPVPVPLP